MESLKNDPLLAFHDDTFQSVRKEYDLDKPGRMDQAIDIIVEWLKKQEHFLMKDFPRDYLERKIIICKGSLERVKTQLDRTCVYRTLMPIFYENINFKTDYKERGVIIDAALPKLTEDHYRIYFLKAIGNRFENGFLNFYRFVFSIVEYILAHDYCKGIIFIYEITEANLLEIMKALDVSLMRQVFSLLVEAYGMRIKAVHVICAAKSVEALITIFKQVISSKIARRIHVHKDVESLHKIVPKTLLPTEVGGSVGSIKDLHEKWIDAISSREFQELYNKMKEAKTNEEYRQLDKFKNEYLGMPGTFRSLNVD